MKSEGYGAYVDSMVHTTQNKGDILLMLYEGAIKFVNLARKGFEEKSPGMRGENITKIMTILIELDYALDRKVEVDLTEKVSDLYQYMIGRLSFANTNNDIEALDEVGTLLSELKKGFEGAIKNRGRGPHAQAETREGTGAYGGIHVAV